MENVDLVRRCLEDWNRGDRSVDPDVFHPDVELLPLRAATEGPYRGLAGIEAFVADTFEVFDRFEMGIELEDLGEQVLASGTIHVRARAAAWRRISKAAVSLSSVMARSCAGRTSGQRRMRSKLWGRREPN
jgi:ketosteroid isomerase-like protein